MLRNKVTFIDTDTSYIEKPLLKTNKKRTIRFGDFAMRKIIAKPINLLVI